MRLLLVVSAAASIGAACTASPPSVRHGQSGPSVTIPAPPTTTVVAPATPLPPTTAAAPATPAPPPSPSPAPVDPGTLPQTRAVPSAATAAFRTRMAALFQGIVADEVGTAMPAFFPKAAYLQVKDISDPGLDFRDRLVSAFRQDLHAAHQLLGADAGMARLVEVLVPAQWAWIPPGGCSNKVGYWHAPGSRLVYRENGHLRSFGVFSLISWRGEWYVVHLSSYDSPGTVDSPSSGRGSFGPPGGC